MKVFLSCTNYIDDACNGDEFYMMIMIEMMRMMMMTDMMNIFIDSYIYTYLDIRKLVHILPKMGLGR